MHTILNKPRIYNLFTRVIGRNARKVYVEKYIRPKEGDRIFDIGCGTADILSLLPTVEYVGIDANQKYIKYAKKRFGEKGIFLANRLKEAPMSELSGFGFDKVLATAVLHHLNDDEARQLFEFAKVALKPGGRLITFDGCYSHS